MAKIFYALLLFPLLAYAVPESKVYPNSGATDAKRDENTGVDQASPGPISQGTGAQQQQERPKEDPNAIPVGPYDKDGQYIYLQKKP